MIIFMIYTMISINQISLDVAVNHKMIESNRNNIETNLKEIKKLNTSPAIDSIINKIDTSIQ